MLWWKGGNESGERERGWNGKKEMEWIFVCPKRTQTDGNWASLNKCWTLLSLSLFIHLFYQYNHNTSSWCCDKHTYSSDGGKTVKWNWNNNRNRGKLEKIEMDHTCLSSFLTVILLDHNSLWSQFSLFTNFLYYTNGSY